VLMLLFVNHNVLVELVISVIGKRDVAHVIVALMKMLMNICKDIRAWHMHEQHGNLWTWLQKRVVLQVLREN